MTGRGLMLVAVSTLLFGAVLASAAVAKDLSGSSNIGAVRELYDQVQRTMPSEVNAQENTEVIRERLRCYEKNHDYAERIQICNNAYVKNIVALARKAIRARPSLGEFVSNVDSCPVLYNLCMGKTEQDKSRCVLFERQCIDYTLDTYWRGSAPYTQQTYRSDR